MQRPILRLPPKSAPRTHSNRRARNQFRAWCIAELNKRGAKLSNCPKYIELRDAIERFGLGRR